MSIDYSIIKKNPDIKVEITKGSGEPLINLVLTYPKKSGQQEYVYPAKPQEIYGILEELTRKQIIDEAKFAEIKQQVGDLEARLPTY